MRQSIQVSWGLPVAGGRRQRFHGARIIGKSTNQRPERGKARGGNRRGSARRYDEALSGSFDGSLSMVESERKSALMPPAKRPVVADRMVERPILPCMCDPSR
jgi:hypothetical protein